MVETPTGELLRLRDDWRLWLGLFALAWCLAGRLIAVRLLAKRDSRPTRPSRGEGEFITGTSGSSLYTEVIGPADAPTVIFTHGWGMDSTFWHYAKLDLSPRFRVVVWDLPGLGRSTPSGPQAISLDAFAADLGMLVSRYWPPVVLVGHSIGGMTIQTLLRNNPAIRDKVAGVVLLNTTYTNPLKTMVLGRLLLALQPAVLEPMAKLTIWLSPIVWLGKWQSYLSGSAHFAMRLGCGKYVTRSQLEHVALLATRASPAIEARGDLAMFRWDATGALKDIDIPVLVIGGDMDVVTKLEASRVIADESPRATLQAVEGVNHMGPLERADLYNRMIEDLAASSSARAPSSTPSALSAKGQRVTPHA